MRYLKQRFHAFLRNEDGLVLAEALVALFIYWDVFRTINITQKAAYSVADLLSRQENVISLQYADGLQNVVDFLTPGGHPMALRITSFQYNETNDDYELLFSYSPQGKVPVLTESDIQVWKTEERIPNLSHLEAVFVVESEVQFTAQLQTAIAGLMVGVEDQTFGQFIVTRPRHRRLCLEGVPTCS
jgi:hypothetical protein